MRLRVERHYCAPALKDFTIPVCDIKYRSFPDMSPCKSTFEVQNDMKENLPENNEITVRRKSPRKKVKVEEENRENEDYKEEKLKPTRKKVVKVIDIKPEDESDSDEDVSASGYVKTNGISEYEKMIERNRAERLAFLRSIKLEEAKSDLVEAVNSIKKKVQPVKRFFRKVENTSPPVLRKSKRLANITADLSEDALFQKALNEIKIEQKLELFLKEKKNQREPGSNRKLIKTFKTSFKKDIQELPAEMSFEEAMQHEEIYNDYVKDVCIQESKTENKFFHYDKSVIEKLTLDMENIAKVTPDRITALAWYPSPEYLVLAAGSKYGNLGIWNVDSESSPYVFKNHVEGITNLQFNPLNSVQLVSSSYDGTLRSGDLVKHTFDELYNISDETCCTYFDFLSQTTYLVAQKNGQVALVDNRTEGKRCEKKHTCHDYSVKTVNVHPVNKNFFVTAENKGSIRLWDLRKLQKQPVADITHHKRCVQSAFFSPVTGNSILATSTDDTISIFDSTELTKDIKLQKLMKHNNHTGRWLSIFRATWLPNSEEAFVIGSMQEPRRIQVFSKNMDVCHILMHENLTTISSTNAFHPFRSALAGANSGGKVFVFT